MDVQVVSRFFVLLALSALVLVVAGSYELVTGRGSLLTRAAGVSGLLGVAWVIAATATTGSLYYSEIAGFEPCTLCWYQRIAMYPLVVVLGVAALRADTDVWRTAVPLAGIGAGISAYHYLVQHVPSLGPDTCSASAPCTAAYVWEFGFISIPFMAGVGFLAITVLLLLTRKVPS